MIKANVFSDNYGYILGNEISGQIITGYFTEMELVVQFGSKLSRHDYNNIMIVYNLINYDISCYFKKKIFNYFTQ